MKKYSLFNTMFNTMRNILPSTFNAFNAVNIFNRFLFLLFAIFLSFAQTAQGQLPKDFPSEAFWYDGKWAQEKSELKPDDRILYGRLENGFRYLILPNELPEGRLSLYLNVQVGSLMEEENELGFAHYLEHMAFNGSKNFPAGSLIPFFQENGMSFGGDINAHTSLAETVYKLNLATTDEKTLNSGLEILRDYADGLLLEEKEVQEEKGIILAEKKVRDSEARQAWDKRMDFFYEGTRFVNPVIGTDDTIKSATHENIMAFYEKWYQPERMILVAVGSVEPEELAPMIEKAFASMEKGDLREIPSWGDTPLKGFRVRVEERPMSGSSISVMIHHPRVHEHDSFSVQKNSTIQMLSSVIMNERLGLVEEVDPSIWNGVQFYGYWRDNMTSAVSFSAMAPKDTWENVLVVLAEEIHRVIEYGFTQEEVDNALDYVENVYKQRADQQDVMLNETLANEIIFSLNNDRVYTSSADDIASLKKIRETLSLDDINMEIRRAFNLENMSIIIAQDTAVDKEEVAQVWQEAISAPVDEFSLSAKKDFPYLPIPEQVSLHDLPELKSAPLDINDAKMPTLYFATLANNVEIYLMPMSWEKESVTLNLFYGEPMRVMSDKEVRTAKFANMLLPELGLGNLGTSATQNLYKNINGFLNEQITFYGSIISAYAPTSNLEPLVQMAWTQYLDPEITQNGIDKVVMKMESQEYRRYNTIEGVNFAESRAFFYGEEKRFESINLKEARKVRQRSLEKMLESQREHRPLRILLTGDFDPNLAYTILAQYFGNIPMPEYVAKNVKIGLPVFPSGIIEEREVDDIVDKAVFRVAWQSDLENITDRKLYATRQVTASVLDEFLRREVRENLGIAYSPYAYYSTSIVDDGYGMYVMNIDTETRNIEQVRDVINNISTLSIDQEELDRLKAPLLTQWKSSRSRPAMWENIFYTGLLQDLPLIKWNNNYANMLELVSVEDVNAELDKIFSSATSDMKAQWVLISEGKKEIEEDVLDEKSVSNQ